MIQLIGDYTRQNNRMNSDWVNGALCLKSPRQRLHEYR